MVRVLPFVLLGNVAAASEGNCSSGATEMSSTDNVMLQTRSSLAASMSHDEHQYQGNLVYNGVEACTPEHPCPPCEGDCDTDDDCAGGGKCLQRNGREQVPGCTTGGAADMVAIDYCYKELEDLGGSGCTASHPCGLCQGDCDSNADCADGLVCFQRDGQASVPYCGGGGAGDHSNYDICTIANIDDYHPGSGGARGGGGGGGGGGAAAGGNAPAAYQAVLARHNVLRCLHGAPPLTWDAELASVAQRLANTGHYGHGMTDRVYHGEDVGQNIAMGTIPDFIRFTNMWYDEISLTPGRRGGGPGRAWSRSPSGTGHYTQVVWAGTQKLGCGHHPAGSGTFFVCDYYPQGNMLGPVGNEYDTNVHALSRSEAQCGR